MLRTILHLVMDLGRVPGSSSNETFDVPIPAKNAATFGVKTSKIWVLHPVQEPWPYWDRYSVFDTEVECPERWRVTDSLWLGHQTCLLTTGPLRTFIQGYSQYGFEQSKTSLWTFVLDVKANDHMLYKATGKNNFKWVYINVLCRASANGLTTHMGIGKTFQLP